MAKIIISANVDFSDALLFICSSLSLIPWVGLMTPLCYSYCPIAKCSSLVKPSASPHTRGNICSLTMAILAAMLRQIINTYIQ